MRSGSGNSAGRRLSAALFFAAGLALAGRLVADAASAAVDPNAAQPDALTVFDRARAAVAARTMPAFIAYTQYAAFIRGSKVRAEQTRVVLRAADGKVNVTPIPDSPRDRIDTTPAVKDRPLVYPTTTFGLVPRRTAEAPSTFENTSTPAPASSGTPVIGRVAAVTRDYDPIFIGTENLGGASVYHLKLVPRFDAQHHPIRALWIDTTSYDPRRIAIEVWAKAGPVRSRPTVTVDYAPVGGVWLISHAALNFVLRFAFLSYAGSGELRISDVTFPATEPAALFERPDSAHHPRTAAPDPAATPESGAATATPH